jgi:hypothetical protein
MAVSVTQKRLYRVGARPLESALDEVKELAETVWYQGYRPTSAELEHLSSIMSPEGFQRSLCVLELLSQYPVCPRDTARHLQRLTRRFHRLLLGNDHAPVQGRYSPSKRWGLADQTTSLRKELLPMQTRTYADSTGHHHGLSIE